MSQFAIQIFQIGLGIAILITLLIIAFKIGTWSTRLNVLERILGPYIQKVDTIDKNVAILLAHQIVKGEDGKSLH